MSALIADVSGLREVGRDALGPLFAGSRDGTGNLVLVRIFERSVSEGQLLMLSSPSFTSPPDEALAAIIAVGRTGDARTYVVIDADLPVDWAERRDRGEPLTPDEAVALLLTACDALSALHERGVCYGAITPDSIIRPTPDRWRLIDPGIAAVAIPLPPAAGAAINGVLAYTAPEVIDGSSCSPASDVYSLAATVIELITESAIERSSAGADPLAPTGPFRDLPVPEALWRALGAATDPIPARRPGLSALRACAAAVGHGRAEDSITAVAPAGSRQGEVLDDDVQFTVYRPHSVQPGRWSTLLAFAHKSELFVDDELGAIDPLEDMRRQASSRLGADLGGYGTASEDSSQQLPRGSSLTFVPEVEGVEFNPPRREFLWMEPVHEEEFRMRAESRLEGQRARGRLSVYFGTILIAEVSLSFAVSAGQDSAAVGREHARPYRKIFISYSHRDRAVVEQVETFLSVVGDEFLRDAKDLRSGEVWEERIAAMIREADVFQLFWSTNSMRSPFVRREWTYALGLNRASFIRPTYWESPMPEIPSENLPPDELRRLHFRFLPAATGAAHPAPPPGRATEAQAPNRPSTGPRSLGRLVTIGSGVAGSFVLILLAVTSLLGGSSTQLAPGRADFSRTATIIDGGRGVQVGGPITCRSGDAVQLQARLLERATGATARGSWSGPCAGHSRRWMTVVTVAYGRLFTAGCGQAAGVAAVIRGRTTVQHLSWRNPVVLTVYGRATAGGQPRC